MFSLQLWGSDINLTPRLSSNPSSFMPILQAMGWPWSHPQVYLQSQMAVESGLYNYYAQGSYTIYLLSPSAPIYSLHTLLPVTNYAYLLRSLWWETDFSKYGDQALKITNVANRDIRLHPIQATLASRYNNFESLLSKQNQLQYTINSQNNLLRSDDVCGWHLAHIHIVPLVRML